MRKYIVFIIAAILLSFISAEGGTNYKVVDGDSLEKGDERIRLIGIDAPEYLQECYDNKGEAYRCGLKSGEYLKSLLQGKISCHSFGQDRYNRSLEECYNSLGVNINRQMVLDGWAVAYGDEYVAEEKIAHRKKLGLWQGKFMRPELFRALKRSQDKHNKNKKR